MSVADWQATHGTGMRAQELCVPGMERVESGQVEGRCVSQDVRGIFAKVVVAVRGWVWISRASIVVDIDAAGKVGSSYR